jgi:hypothetical protein
MVLNINFLYPFRFFLAGLCLFTLSACTTQAPSHSGVEVVDVRPPAREPVSLPPTTNIAVPDDAINELLTQSARWISAKDWWQAIEVAERGLRLDRREPKFFAILAKSYNALGEQGRAADFAQQGLRFCEPNSLIFKELSNYMN